MIQKTLIPKVHDISINGGIVAQFSQSLGNKNTCISKFKIEISLAFKARRD
jgi:hypothetical protein